MKIIRPLSDRIREAKAKQARNAKRKMKKNITPKAVEPDEVNSSFIVNKHDYEYNHSLIAELDGVTVGLSDKISAVVDGVCRGVGT
jgi:hypothetical protein